MWPVLLKTRMSLKRKRNRVLENKMNRTQFLLNDAVRELDIHDENEGKMYLSRLSIVYALHNRITSGSGREGGGKQVDKRQPTTPFTFVSRNGWREPTQTAGQVRTK